MESLDVLSWWMNNPEMWDDDSVGTPEDVVIVETVKRGHEDGSIDPEIRPEWLESMLWAALYASHFISPDSGLSSFDVRDQALRTLMKLATANVVNTHPAG